MVMRVLKSHSVVFSPFFSLTGGADISINTQTHNYGHFFMCVSTVPQWLRFIKQSQVFPYENAAAYFCLCVYSQFQLWVSSGEGEMSLDELLEKLCWTMTPLECCRPPFTSIIKPSSTAEQTGRGSAAKQLLYYRQQHCVEGQRGVGTDTSPAALHQDCTY